MVAGSIRRASIQIGKTGDYHCHRTPTAPTPPTTPSPSRDSNVVKKSNSGICHDSSSRWYAQKIHYTAFSTLQECLDRGGRLPKLTRRAFHLRSCARRNRLVTQR